MPRAKNDIPKRKCAQTLNHLAMAVMDVNEVYELFDTSIQRMREAAINDPSVNNAEAIKRYQDYKERLKQVMMYIIVPREDLLKFIDEAWELDEEAIRVYLG
jgi:hypothetical protein